VLVGVIIGLHNCCKWDDMKDHISENLVLSLYFWMFLRFSVNCDENGSFSISGTHTAVGRGGSVLGGLCPDTFQ